MNLTIQFPYIMESGLYVQVGAQKFGHCEGRTGENDLPYNAM